MVFQYLLNSAEDTKPPRAVNCPSDIYTTLDVGSSQISVSWIEPTAEDDSGNVTLVFKTRSPGDLFHIGGLTVIYVFADSSDNVATCSFIVTIKPGMFVFEKFIIGVIIFFF